MTQLNFGTGFGLVVSCCVSLPSKGGVAAAKRSPTRNFKPLAHQKIVLMFLGVNLDNLDTLPMGPCDGFKETEVVQLDDTPVKDGVSCFDWTAQEAAVVDPKKDTVVDERDVVPPSQKDLFLADEEVAGLKTPRCEFGCQVDSSSGAWIGP